MKVSHVGSAIIGIVLLSCATPTENELPSVDLLTDRTTYAMGDSGVLSLTNRSANPILGDLRCGVAIQRMVATSWESVGGLPGWCIMEDVDTLDASASVERGFELAAPAFASAGEYRLQVSAADPRRRQPFVVSSDPFTVEN